MPTLKIKDDLQFFYTDSGIPSQAEYTTVIAFHGHTFHQGVFHRLFPIALGKGLRIITPNRRAYYGTTPYTLDELRILNSGTSEEQKAVFDAQGMYLSLLVDGLIQKHKLEKGKVALLGWSLGCTFLLKMVGSISELGKDTQTRLKEHVSTIIMWDAPSRLLGMEDPPQGYIPLYDDAISVEQRGPAFGEWVASYFPHTDITSRDPDTLKYRQPSLDKKPTFSDATYEEFLSVGDPTSGEKGDTVIGEPPLRLLLLDAAIKGLLTPEVREAWGQPHVCHLYGDQTPWNVIFAAWWVQDQIKQANDNHLAVTFRVGEGWNHFAMWERPEDVVSVIADLVHRV